jgi:hypothetical protein
MNRALSFLHKRLPEKETEIKVLARQLEREALADRRKKEKPADNQDNDCNDYRIHSCLGSIILHAITS